MLITILGCYMLSGLIGTTASCAGANVIHRVITDPTAEGKKRGFEIAANEYEPIYAKLKDQYEEERDKYRQIMQSNDNELSELIEELKKLEKEEQHLNKVKIIKQKELRHKNRNTALDDNMSEGNGKMLACYGSLLGIYKPWYDKKFNEAEAEGYRQATDVYERKLTALKNNLIKLIKEFENEISIHDTIITDAMGEISQKLSCIARLEMEIANLNLISCCEV